MDQRRDQLAHWAANIIKQLSELDVNPELEVVSGDASFRRYFRVHQQTAGCDIMAAAGDGTQHSNQHSVQRRPLSWIAVDAPADKEDNPRFVRIARQWRKAGVQVPEVLAEDFQQGFMLLQDFGDQLLWPALHPAEPLTEPEASSPSENAPADDQQRVKNLYRQAIEQLLCIQQLDGRELPGYDAALLDQEMALFSDWLCQQKLQMTLSDDEQQMLQQVFTALRQRALAQPQVVVHRDYHSRNLMLLTQQRQDLPSLGVIDFQDAVVGAATYDLVSLLRDCYVRWPPSWVMDLAADYWQQAREQGLYLHDWPVFVQDFDWMGMQRHLKAAGIFARLQLRDGKDGYLADIPNTCRYLFEISALYPEFSAFNKWLEARFWPALQQQLGAPPLSQLVQSQVVQSPVVQGQAGSQDVLL